MTKQKVVKAVPAVNQLAVSDRVVIRKVVKTVPTAAKHFWSMIMLTAVVFVAIYALTA